MIGGGDLVLTFLTGHHTIGAIILIITMATTHALHSTITAIYMVMHGITHVQFATVTFLIALTLVMRHVAQRQVAVTMHASMQLTLNV